MKQETLEEVAKSHAIYELENNYNPTKESFKLACKRNFIRGYNLAKEQSNCELSELLEQRNEMLAILEDLYEDVECWSDISSYGYGNKIEQLIKKVKDNE